MTATRLPSPVLLVTDRHQACRPLRDLVVELLDAGADWIWLRDRDLPADERSALAIEIAAVVRRHDHAVLTVGEDIGLAAHVGATGVQLRSAAQVAEARLRLGSGAVIGVSAHALADVRTAAEAGADYVTLSPIFSSPSKPSYGPPLGLEAITDAGRIGVPVVALGGVDADNAAACLRSGAAGVAVMGEGMRGGAPAMRAIRRAVARTGQPATAAGHRH